MKKKTIRSLSLTKETVANLQVQEMQNIKGASVPALSCGCDTASCSFVYACCRTTTGIEANQLELDLT